MVNRLAGYHHGAMEVVLICVRAIQHALVLFALLGGQLSHTNINGCHSWAIDNRHSNQRVYGQMYRERGRERERMERIGSVKNATV